MDAQSLQELLAWRPKPIVNIVSDGILQANSRMVLFGAPKVSKSILAQQLAFCVAAGQPWLGFNTLPMRVLYIQGEISRYMFHARVVQMATKFPIGQNTLYFATEFGFKLDKATFKDDMHRVIDKLGTNMLFVDPMYKFISSSEEMSIMRFTDALDEAMHAHNQTIVLVHHSRKTQITSTGPVDMGGAELRGPLVEQWADSIVRVRGDIDTPYRVMDFELRNGPPLAEINLELDTQAMWFNKV